MYNDLDTMQHTGLFLFLAKSASSKFLPQSHLSITNNRSEKPNLAYWLSDQGHEWREWYIDVQLIIADTGIP
jgi:hypothetical protein